MKLNEKDLSMLEERIKRSAKAPAAAKPVVEKVRRNSIRKPVHEEAPKVRYVQDTPSRPFNGRFQYPSLDKCHLVWDSLPNVSYVYVKKI